jgi:integrase
VTLDARRLVSNAARETTLESEAKAALKISTLRRICAALGDSPIDVRDRAMLLLGFATGCRRSEIAALLLSDVEIEECGLRVRVRRSKTGQKGQGREIGIRRGRRIATCPVRRLERWIDLRGNWHGPLFSAVRGKNGTTVSKEKLHGRVICSRLHRALRRIGEDPSAYGAHSLRAGMVTAGVENGSSTLAIMQRTGHKPVTMMQRYVRNVEIFLGPDPLEGVL